MAGMSSVKIKYSNIIRLNSNSIRTNLFIDLTLCLLISIPRTTLVAILPTTLMSKTLTLKVTLFNANHKK